MWRASLMTLAAVALVAAACGGDVASTDNGGSTGSATGSGTGTATGSGTATGTTSGTSTGDGGSGGSGGTGSGMTTGGGGTGGAFDNMPECTFGATECTLGEDCCTCAALAPGESLPPCAVQNCLVPKCQEMMFNEAPQCIVGRCVAGFDCDHSTVLCLAPEPACDPGQIAEVENGCWTGNCVLLVECASLADCSRCTANQLCVTEVTQIGLVEHCVTVPAACDGVPKCDCMGASVCIDPFNVCSDDPMGGLSCNCPTC